MGEMDRGREWESFIAPLRAVAQLLVASVLLPLCQLRLSQSHCLVVIVTMPSFRFHWGHSEGVWVGFWDFRDPVCFFALGVGWAVHLIWQSRLQKPRYNSMLCPVWSMSQSLRRPVNIGTESVAAAGRVSGWVGSVGNLSSRLVSSHP